MPAGLGAAVPEASTKEGRRASEPTPAWLSLAVSTTGAPGDNAAVKN